MSYIVIEMLRDYRAIYCMTILTCVIPVVLDNSKELGVLILAPIL